MINWPANKPIRLRNETCPYCGRSFSEDLPSTIEHVIGRRFVPKGSWNGCWNLILRACEECNRTKSTLKDDISAITLHPDAAGRTTRDDPALRAEAVRKAKGSTSKRTGKKVVDSKESFEIKGKLMEDVTAKFTFTGPPQIDEDRMLKLASFHLMAFFYYISYNDETGRGGFWPGGLYFVMEAHRGDWGNSTMRAFMSAVGKWEPRLLAVGAAGFFKILIRRYPGAATWAWALEWNERWRLVGFFGEEALAQTIVNAFPELKFSSIRQTESEFMRSRLEEPLSDDDDALFR